MKAICLIAVFPVLLWAVDLKPKEAPPAPAAIVAALPEEAPAVPSVTEAPQWLVKSLEAVESLPVVGPAVVAVAKWLGVLASVATILVTALLGILRALALVLPAVRLANLVAWVVAIENSQVLYWLKMVSIYNAKKNEEKKS